MSSKRGQENNSVPHKVNAGILPTVLLTSNWPTLARCILYVSLWINLNISIQKLHNQFINPN